MRIALALAGGVNMTRQDLLLRPGPAPRSITPAHLLPAPERSGAAHEAPGRCLD
jgi:hypothetical protein